MSRRPLTFGAVFAVVILLLFYAITLSALSALYHLSNMLSGGVAYVFVSINFVVLIMLVISGAVMEKSFAQRVQLWTITVIYSLVQFILLFLTVNIWKWPLYTVCHIFLMVLWLTICGAIVLAGSNTANAHGELSEFNQIQEK